MTSGLNFHQGSIDTMYHRQRGNPNADRIVRGAHPGGATPPFEDYTNFLYLGGLATPKAEVVANLDVGRSRMGGARKRVAQFSE
jgi:hypothetical protein